MQASRQNNLSEESDDHKESVKGGRARIGPPPRYEEVGISGLPILVIMNRYYGYCVLNLTTGQSQVC